MASTYSDSLRIELIGTGDQSGTWGVTLNRNLGTLLEEAIVGHATVTVTDSSSATALTVSDGLSSSARHYVLVLSGALTADRTVEVPAKEKTYLIYNNTTGGHSVTVKVNGQTGVTVLNGKKRLVHCNGTDVFDQITDLPASVTVNGVVPLTEDTENFNGTTAAFSTSTTTAKVVLNDGSNSAPSLTFSGDSNTGFYRIGADQIGATLGGVLRVTLDTSGMSVTGTLSVSGNTTLTGALTGSSASLSSTLTVTGGATFNGGITSTTGNFTGVLTVRSGTISMFGANGDANQGVLYFNQSGTRYLYYNGVKYTFNGAAVSVPSLESTGNIQGSDLYSIRTGTPTTGVVFLGNSGSRYLHWDGGNYVMPGADLFLNGRAVNATLDAKGGVFASNTWTGTNVFAGAVVISGGTPTLQMADTNGGATGAGTRYLYTEGGLIGFLSTSSGWTAYSGDNGTFFAGSYATFSDERLKTDISTISPSEATDLVRKTQGVRYTDIETQDRRIGMVAQHLQPHLPELIEKGHKDLLMVKYQNYVAVLNESLKDAHDKLDAALARIAELEKKL